MFDSHLYHHVARNYENKHFPFSYLDDDPLEWAIYDVDGKAWVYCHTKKQAQEEFDRLFNELFYKFA